MSNQTFFIEFKNFHFLKLQYSIISSNSFKIIPNSFEDALDLFDNRFHFQVLIYVNKIVESQSKYLILQKSKIFHVLSVFFDWFRRKVLLLECHLCNISVQKHMLFVQIVAIFQYEEVFTEKKSNNEHYCETIKLFAYLRKILKKYLWILN